MGWPKREDSRIVDQNVDVPVSEFHRSSRDFPRACRVPKVKRYKVCFASCCADFGNRIFATIGIATDDYDMDAKLSQFIGCRTANTACSPCNECCRRIISHFASSLNLKPNIYVPRRGQKTGRGTRPILLLTPTTARPVNTGSYRLVRPGDAASNGLKIR